MMLSNYILENKIIIQEAKSYATRLLKLFFTKFKLSDICKQSFKTDKLANSLINDTMVNVVKKKIIDNKENVLFNVYNVTFNGNDFIINKNRLIELLKDNMYYVVDRTIDDKINIVVVPYEVLNDFLKVKDKIDYSGSNLRERKYRSALPSNSKYGTILYMVPFVGTSSVGWNKTTDAVNNVTKYDQFLDVNTGKFVNPDEIIDPELFTHVDEPESRSSIKNKTFDRTKWKSSIPDDDEEVKSDSSVQVYKKGDKDANDYMPLATKTYKTKPTSKSNSNNINKSKKDFLMDYSTPLQVKDILGDTNTPSNISKLLNNIYNLTEQNKYKFVIRKIVDSKIVDFMITPEFDDDGVLSKFLQNKILVDKNGKIYEETSNTYEGIVAFQHLESILFNKKCTFYKWDSSYTEKVSPVDVQLPQKIKQLSSPESVSIKKSRQQIMDIISDFKVSLSTVTGGGNSRGLSLYELLNAIKYNIQNDPLIIHTGKTDRLILIKPNPKHNNKIASDYTIYVPFYKNGKIEFSSDMKDTVKASTDLAALQGYLGILGSSVNELYVIDDPNLVVDKDKLKELMPKPIQTDDDVEDVEPTDDQIDSIDNEYKESFEIYLNKKINLIYS